MRNFEKMSIRTGVLILLLSLLLPILSNANAAALYTVKSTSSQTLAPGIIQKIHTATYPDDNRTVKYYVTTADINRSDVMVLNGYKDNKPTFNSYVSATVDKQIIASEKAHQDPSDPRYIENYRVVAACNGGFFNIPVISGIEGVSGAHIMEGVQYWPYDGRPFFAILKDGSAVIGSGTTDWNKYREHMWEAISGNVLLVNKGVNNTGNVDEDKAFVGQEASKLGTKRHPRTCVGITQEGKVVMMVIDAQSTASSGTRGGATLNEAAQMLIDAGCYYAINMDGGGSSTYMTKAEGQTEPTLVNVPSDGSMRAISGSLLFASVAPTDHLSFDFDGTGGSRYLREFYSRRNYDQAAYWATGLSGTGSGDVAVVMDTAASTMTINLTKRDGTHSTYFAPGGKNGTFNDAEATTSTAFTYDPSRAEIFRVRLKFNDAKRYSASHTPMFAMSYLPEDTRTWTGFNIKSNISDAYIDGGASEGQYVTLTMDLSNHAIRNVSKIVSMRFQIGYLREGTCSIDSIYLGPKSGDRLLFGFGEFANERAAFNDPAYNYLDFNREYHWFKGSELTSMDINHGVLTMKIDSSPSNVNNAYVETSLSHTKSVHPLRFTPKSGDIVQVRYKLLSYDKTANVNIYGADTVPMLTIYGYNDRQNVYKNPPTQVIDVTNTGYAVREWTVPAEWTSYDMSKIRLTVRYMVNSSIEIDSIYIGPKSGAPANDRLHIGFDNKEADRVRYTSDIYGGMNMDKAGNWSVGNEYNLPTITGGYMKLTPTTTHTGYGYVHSGSVNTVYPLSYTPNANDYLQIRFKIDNGQATNKYADRMGVGRLAFFYGNSDIGYRNSYVYHDFQVTDVSGKGWIIVTYKLSSMKTNGTNITALSEVTSISPCFNWIRSVDGKTAAFYLDYIYVGPQSGLPTPQYTVTFKGATGETLVTQTVYKGAAATYTGATPTKAYDTTNHYTFKGWDKALTNITANTTITATFTATAHSYTYSKVDTTNHKAACTCGYSKNVAHSYTFKATKNPTTSATGTLTGTCSVCSQTTTVTLPKLNTTDYTKTVTKAATCTDTGTDTYKWKTTTYGSFSFTATTAKLGHKYDSGSITTKPTLSAKGVKTFTCQNDKTHTYTEEVAVLHNSLLFDFNNNSTAQTRYNNYVYNFKNFDQVAAWKGRTTGYKDGTITIDTSASTATVKPGVTGYASIYADSVNYDLNYDPDNADYFQIKFKMTGFTGTTGKASVHFYYSTDNSYKSATSASFPASYLSSGTYYTVTGKIQSEIRSLAEINRVVIHLSGFDSTTDLNGVAVFDYAYIGPLSGLPTSAYTVTFKDAAGNVLATDLVTKGNTAVYSGATPTKASDSTNHYAYKGWDKALTNITADTTVTATYTATAHSFTYAKVDTTNHKATCTCGYSDNRAHSYTYKATKNPTTSATGVLTGTCSRCSGTTTVTLPKLNTTDYTKTVTKAPTCTATGTDTYKWKTTTYGTFSFTATTAKLGHKYDSGKITTKPTLTAKGVKTFTCQNDSSHTTTEAVDMLSKSLYFHFDNSSAAQTRYNNYVYNFKNFDQAAAWRGRTTGYKDGTLTLDTSASTVTVKPGVLGYSGIYADSVNYDLNYDPDYADYFQIRFKMTGFIGNVGKASVYFYYSTDNSYTVATTQTFQASYLASDTWLTVTGKIQDAVRAHAEINRVVIHLSGITAASTTLDGVLTLDYCYVGPADGLPTPAYTVTFKDAAGTTLETRLVTKGEAAFYTDATPTKASDATNHYTFKGWDKALTNITANTTITATYTATAHSFTYAKVDTTNHKATCTCGYSANQSHSYTYKATTNPTTSATGALTGTCSKCSQTTTVTLPKLNTTDYTKTTTKAPTCTAKGTDKYVWKTTTYGTFSFTASTKALGHTEVTDKAVAPTCTATGLTEGKHCSVCNTVLTAQQLVPAKGHTEVTDSAVAPTCTATGLTEGKHCSVCNIVLVAQEEIPATGHAPIYTPKDGDTHVVTCKNCNHSEEAPHSYENGVCICGQTEIKEPILQTTWKMGHTLNLASDISVNLAVSKSLFTGFDMDSVYVLAQIDTYEGNTPTGTETVKLLPVEQGNYYYFTLTGLTAVHMNDRIHSVLYGTKDGQPYYSATDNYSITDYAYAQMNKAIMPDTLKTLCADLLRYGAKAQIFKAYRTDTLADAAMTDNHKAYLSDMETVTFGNTNTVLNDLQGATVTWAGKALDLASKVTLKFIFSPANYKGTPENLNLHLTYADISGETKTVILEGAELYNVERGFYAFSFDGLLAAELRTIVSAQVYEGNTPVSCTLQYSADTYGKNKTGPLGDLCKALFAYSDSAKVYFTN